MRKDKLKNQMVDYVNQIVNSEAHQKYRLDFGVWPDFTQTFEVRLKYLYILTKTVLKLVRMPSKKGKEKIRIIRTRVLKRWLIMRLCGVKKGLYALPFGWFGSATNCTAEVVGGEVVVKVKCRIVHAKVSD